MNGLAQSWIAPLAAAGGGEGSAVAPSFEGMLVYMVIVLAVIGWATWRMRQGLSKRTFTNRVAKYAEHLYLFIENMTVGIIGAHGRKYIPFILTLWLLIFVGNVMALFFPYSITMDLGFNLGMAVVAIAYVQYEGIRANGLIGHLRHFAGPKMGGALVIVSGMIFVIEIISELMKNVSLSLRLFGNIEGGHLVTEALTNATTFKIGTMYWGFPSGALLLPVKLMTCLIQAMIFTLLTCVYLSLVTHHDEEHATGGEAAAH